MKRETFNLWLLAALAALLAACANIGSPEGGPRDYTPPRVTRTSPAMGACGVGSNKFEISFDEIVNIKDQQKKVSVSPVQHDPPLIRAMGKKITIELRDTLQPDATYVIDFANSIEDNNEGNRLDGLAYTFATGEQLDTLQMSGIVLRARDLEPMQYVLVGLHTNLSDTAFTRLPFERVTRTNDRGQFTLRGLKPGSYRVYALNDVDGDYRMARTEDAAFIDSIVVPAAHRFVSSDTVFTFDHRIDTVTEAAHTRFTPDDLLLPMFNEGYKALYLKKSERPSPAKLLVQFGAAPDSLPTLRVLQPAVEGEWCRLERSVAGDSLVYWLTDSTLIKADTISIETRYLRVDSTENITWHTDTLAFGYAKPPYLIKQEEEKAKQREKAIAQLQQLRDKQAQGKDVDVDEMRELEAEITPPAPKLKVESLAKATIEVTDSVKLRFDAPIATINHDAVHLLIKRDSLWTPVAGAPGLTPVSDRDLFTYCLPTTLQPDSSYRLTVDSLAIASVYGLTNDSLTVEFKVRALEEYANLVMRINVDSTAFVELLDARENVLRRVAVERRVATLANVLPGTYFMRLVIDANGNGRWDTGNYAGHLQPEEVYYYPKPLKLRRNWDVDQQWNIYATPLDKQKPEEIRKTKPEKSNNSLEPEKKKSADDEDEDEFNSQGFSKGVYSGDKYRDYQNAR